MSIIKAARAHTGLTQSEFGELLGALSRGRAITQNRISDYESGRVHPKPDVRAVATPWAARELIRRMQDTPKNELEKLIVEVMR